MTQIAFPWTIASDGRTAGVDEQRHVRDLIEQLLFTSIGERVNRPSFGSGLLRMVFASASDEVAATSQMLIQSALQQWLSDIVQVEAVEVENADSTIRVTVQYVVHRSQTRHTDTFVQEGVG